MAEIKQLIEGSLNTLIGTVRECDKEGRLYIFAWYADGSGQFVLNSYANVNQEDWKTILGDATEEIFDNSIS